jgi:hypothetical protein
MRIFFIILLFLISFNVLAKVNSVFSVRCNFTSGMVTNFENGNPSSKNVTDLSDLIFDQIDIKKNTARLIGNVGTETISVINGMNSVHLLELSDTGNLNTTTIFFSNPDNSGKLPVVHSRHVNGNHPFPSQYLGLCTLLK